MPVTMGLLNFGVVLLLATSLALSNARSKRTTTPAPTTPAGPTEIPNLFTFLFEPAIDKPELLIEKFQALHKATVVTFNTDNKYALTISKVNVTNPSGNLESAELVDRPSGSAGVALRITPKSTRKLALATVHIYGKWNGPKTRILGSDVNFEGLSPMTIGGIAGVDV